MTNWTLKEDLKFVKVSIMRRSRWWDFRGTLYLSSWFSPSWRKDRKGASCGNRARGELLTAVAKAYVLTVERVGRYSWVARPPVFPWKVSPSEVERALFGERFHGNFLSEGSFALPSHIKGLIWNVRRWDKCKLQTKIKRMFMSSNIIERKTTE